MIELIPFGEQLLETKDLDPVYVLLHEAGLPQEQLKKWLLAYWCFYHVGTSSWITDGSKQYWDRFVTAARSKDYPRCHERRHFRGENATKSVAYLAARGVDDLFQPLIDVKAPLADVMSYVKTWVGFGPWIAFKVADMLERLGLATIHFNNGAMFLFDSPREGAELAWEMYGQGPKPERVGEWAVLNILDQVGHVLSPPRYERLVNCQEAETILCKWKSHCNGHYTIGEDIKACRSGLAKFSSSPTSQKLYRAGKAGGLW